MNTVVEARRQMLAEARTQLESMLGQFAVVLPKSIPAERFVRVVLTGLQNNPELLECERRSLFNACMRAATDGLVPDGRLGALVVFKDKRRGKIAQWMPMIAGLRRKVYQSGEIATWDTGVVRERDYYEFERGDNPRIVHREVRGDRGPVIAAYSIAKLRSGEFSREWMWIEEIEQVRAMSRAEHGPWESWLDEMCRKTVARRHFKVLPTGDDIEQMFQREDEQLERPAEKEHEPAALPPRSLTDALNRIAAPGAPHAPEGALEELDYLDNGDQPDLVKQAEAAKT
jgi:recombination protein RecT